MYNNSDYQKLLLRIICCQGAAKTKLILPAMKNCFPEMPELSLNDLVKNINEQIRPYQQNIKIVNDELTNEEFLVFQSLGFDNATKAQNFFSATELEFFRLLIEEIMSANSRQITGIHAINLVGKMKGSFTKTAAQKLLDTWCKMQYLTKTEEHIAFGVRGIHEFESYLRQNMPDTIEECCLCKQIVFRGCNCPFCGLAIHTRCLNHYLEKVVKWPCCKTDYSASQLQQLDQNSSRLSPTQRLNQSEEYNTMVEPNTEQTQEIMSDDIDLTQNTVPDISQCVSRKRKRQVE